MDDLKFRVSAELKNILGRDLITSDNIAIFELVKNSYDAHATKVDITFDEDRIVIADNGKGMSLDDIINKWLFVAYSAKRDGSEDASYRSKFKRNFAGAKGVGRLSCDRLAQKLVMTTQSESDTSANRISLDWGDFEKNQKLEFDEIPVLYEAVSETIKYPQSWTTGTIIELTNLNGDWGKQEILDLRKALEKMINPFAETNDFEIEIVAPLFVASDEKNRNEIKKLQQGTLFEDESILINVAKLENDIVNGPIRNSIASVLKLKTTQIESRIKDGKITTRLMDRGDLMYEIREDSKYLELDGASVDLYFLNRAAKYNFSLRMGVNPVQYGSIFLFRNGFRIWPYGEPGDDSWELDKRALQGYNRFLGTRNLFGRVDVETEDVNKFKEVSSRSGGLVMNEPAKQLHKYFAEVHHRLERYVVGVLWGEGFLRNEYFKNNEQAKAIRLQLTTGDKDSDDVKNALSNIGSRVDFLQLIKSLVNDNSVELINYNTDLANIVYDVSATELINVNLIADMKKVAENSGSAEMKANLEAFERQLEEMRKAKEEAEQRAEKERKAKEEAERKAEEEEAKRIEAEKREQEERRLKEEKDKENRALHQQNLYLSSTQNTTQEAKDLIHAISIAASNLQCSLELLKDLLYNNSGNLTANDIVGYVDDMSFNTSRIINIDSMLTKADISFISESQHVDIMEFVKEYILNYQSSIKVRFGRGYEGLIKKDVKILDLSVVLDNLVSNSKKASATEVMVDFSNEGRKVIMTFSDNGVGVDLNQYSAESIFEPGVTNRRGGSGIGLHTIRHYMQTSLNGDIQFSGNGLEYDKGATFKLIFY